MNIVNFRGGVYSNLYPLLPVKTRHNVCDSPSPHVKEREREGEEGGRKEGQRKGGGREHGQI